jgi:hypothetical protein
MCRSWLCAITLAVIATTTSSGRVAAHAGPSNSFVITHVRVFDGHDMFTRVENEQALRSAAAGRNDVADFRSAGILATAPGGHPTQMGIKIPTVSRAADADAFVGARKAAGSDYLKIVLNSPRRFA